VIPNRALALCALACSPLAAANTAVSFRPGRPAVGPFPSDELTVAEPRMKTGRRVNMPLPDCQSPANLVVCGELAAVNQLDGFGPRQRVRVSFSGPVDPDTLQSGIALVWLDPVWERPFPMGPAGRVTAVNEVVWDVATNTAYARPDEQLEQGRRYALVVTNAVRDRAGDPVVADDSFEACLAGSASPAGCADALAALPTIRRVVRGEVVAVSVYTTLAVTAFLESARSLLPRTDPAFRRTGTRNVFQAAAVRGVTWRRQVRAAGADRFDDVALPLPPGVLEQSGVGRVAFGSFRSPNFLNSLGFIPAAPTGGPGALPDSSNEIHFHAWLPARPAPPGGYPVVIAGHGLGDSRLGMPSILALSFCAQGYAVVAINAVGHGFGPESSIVITEAGGATIDVPAPGRGLPGPDGVIGPFESSIVIAPGAPVFARDTFRQTVLDLSQLVRVIQSGADIEGTGRPVLNGDQISYLGQSLGAFYGTLFAAVEPAVKAAVLNVGGGSVIQTARLSQQFRPLALAYLAARGSLNAGSDANENMPLRYEPVRVNTVRGAIEAQQAFDFLEWIESTGQPSSYAPHLALSTLPGSSIKRVLFQVAIGDRTVPNPQNTALVHASGLAGSASVFRFDRFRGRLAALGDNPHAFLTSILGDIPTAAVGLSTQAQALLFLAGEGNAVPDVNATARLVLGGDAFESGGPLPEELNYGPGPR
jgi:dienelactone hydrolase